MPEIIGDYQYSKRDLIGHGAFAIVFLGHAKNVYILKYIDSNIFIYNLCLRILNSK